MIARGSMVALKGHHNFSMVVKLLVSSDDARDKWREIHAERIRALQSGGLKPDYPPHDTAVTAWLGTNGQPYEATYPLEILEEIDG